MFVSSFPLAACANVNHRVQSVSLLESYCYRRWSTFKFHLAAKKQFAPQLWGYIITRVMMDN